MDDLPVFKPVINIAGVYDPETAEEGKIYLRLVPPEMIDQHSTEMDDDYYKKFCYLSAGVLLIVDHKGKRIEDGTVASFLRNSKYNMAIDYNPHPYVAGHVNIRRGDNGSMYIYIR